MGGKNGDRPGVERGASGAGLARRRFERRTTMANIGDITDSEFEQKVLQSDKPVLIDFWADWCVPCHMVSPVVEEISRDHTEQLTVAKLNIDDNPETARRYGVLSIPTLIVFKDGQEKARVVGA